MQLAVRNRRLNHLVRDLDFDFSFDDLSITGVNEERVREVFKKLHFKTLTERVLRLRGTNPSQTSQSDGAEDSEEQASVFVEMTMPESVAISS